jgi:tripartite-type tricarboxylate transporter receptor subunit TctC
MDKYKTPDTGRRLAKVTLAAGDFGRPLVFPPSVPADRVKVVREAFNKAIKDPVLLAEAQKRNLEIDSTTAEELEGLAKEVIATPPDVVARMAKMLGK